MVGAGVLHVPGQTDVGDVPRALRAVNVEGGMNGFDLFLNQVWQIQGQAQGANACSLAEHAFKGRCSSIPFAPHMRPHCEQLQNDTLMPCACAAMHTVRQHQHSRSTHCTQPSLCVCARNHSNAHARTRARTHTHPPTHTSEHGIFFQNEQLYCIC